MIICREEGFTRLKGAKNVNQSEFVALFNVWIDDSRRGVFRDWLAAETIRVVKVLDDVITIIALLKLDYITMLLIFLMFTWKVAVGFLEIGLVTPLTVTDEIFAMDCCIKSCALFMEVEYVEFTLAQGIVAVLIVHVIVL